MFAYDADLPGEYGTVGINGYKAQCLLTMQTCPENKYGTVGINGYKTPCLLTMQTCPENKYRTVGINGLSTMFTYDADLHGE